MWKLLDSAVPLEQRLSGFTVSQKITKNPPDVPSGRGR
jgi:hypothetical protein